MQAMALFKPENAGYWQPLYTSSAVRNLYWQVFGLLENSLIKMVDISFITEQRDLNVKMPMAARFSKLEYKGLLCEILSDGAANWR